MKVGFFTVFRKDPQHYPLAEALLASVRQIMPDVQVTQFTDEKSPAVRGVDDVIRKPNGKMLERRLEHYADCQGEWLLVDTDVLIKRDVRDVFSAEFDVAVADRNWPHLPQPADVLATMPYNSGVVFSRRSEFWLCVLDEWRAAADNDWLSEQRAVWKAIRTGQFRVRILDGAVYNYPPQSRTDPFKNVCIAHYKGNRKAWMR